MDYGSSATVSMGALHLASGLDRAIIRAATSDEVKELRREAGALKEVVAELTLENRLLKKCMVRPVRARFLDATTATVA